MASGVSSKYMSTSEEFPVHLHRWLRIHKDGRCERFMGNDIVQAEIDPLTGVQSKDVVISLESKVFVRMYVPQTIVCNKKLPILIYYHGGGFVIESTASSTYHPTLKLITKESNVIVVSVNYRLVPEHVIPTAYKDSWEAVKWVATHVKRNGAESWLNDHADFHNVFFGGDSAGGNIAHNMAIQIGLGLNTSEGITLKGVILLHPFFGGKDPIGAESMKNRDYKASMDQVWKLATPSWIGLDYPSFNLAMDPLISSFGCSKILVCVAEWDKLKDRGVNYKKVMENSGWRGSIQIMESKGEGHVFFLRNTLCENACILRSKICAFINPIHSKV